MSRSSINPDILGSECSMHTSRLYDSLVGFSVKRRQIAITFIVWIVVFVFGNMCSIDRIVDMKQHRIGTNIFNTFSHEHLVTCRR